MNWSLLFPAYSVIGIALSVMLLDIIFPKINKSALGYVSGITLVIAAVVVWFLHPEKPESFGQGIIVFDDFTNIYR